MFSALYFRKYLDHFTTFLLMHSNLGEGLGEGVFN